MGKLIVDKIQEFELRVGIMEAEDYFGLPIRPSIGHIFYDWDLNKLLSFVKNNPQYHIVSQFKGRKHNRFCPDANAWYLAHGDSDPEVTFVRTQQYWDKVREALRASKPRSYAKLR